MRNSNIENFSVMYMRKLACIDYIFGFMQLVKYSFEKIAEIHDYEFFSKGPKGRIKKLVRLNATSWRPIPIYNLAFGDWDEEEKEINDTAITNNKDRKKVLSTVAATVLDFIRDRPDSWIIAEGSTPSRTRLYQMGINSIWDEIKDKLTVWGEFNGRWEIFSKNKNFESFILMDKNCKFDPNL